VSFLQNSCVSPSSLPLVGWVCVATSRQKEGEGTKRPPALTSLISELPRSRKYSGSMMGTPFPTVVLPVQYAHYVTYRSVAKLRMCSTDCSSYIGGAINKKSDNGFFGRKVLRRAFVGSYVWMSIVCTVLYLFNC
jgi:hypothetical protein